MATPPFGYVRAPAYRVVRIIHIAASVGDKVVIRRPLDTFLQISVRVAVAGLCALWTEAFGLISGGAARKTSTFPPKVNPAESGQDW